MDRYRRSLRTALVATAGVATALGVASLTQAASGPGSSGTSTAPATATTSTSTAPTQTTTAPKAKHKATTTTRTVRCKAKLYATRPPVSTALEFALLTCASPLGKGVQHNSATVSADPQRTSGSFTGPTRLFFDDGALRGTYKTTFSVANGTVSYNGRIKIASGSGEFKGVRGSATIKGTSHDGLTSALVERLTLTFSRSAG